MGWSCAALLGSATLPDVDSHWLVGDPDVVLDRTAARPAQSLEESHVGHLDMGRHPVTASLGGGAHGEVDEWATHSMAPKLNQHSQSVALPLGRVRRGGEQAHR